MTFPETNWSAVGRAGGGDPLSLNEIVRDYWGPLYAVALLMGLNPNDAEDMVQSFFLCQMIQDKALLKAANPRKGRFRRLLCVSFRNFINSELRKQMTRRRRPGADRLDKPSSPVNEQDVQGEGSSSQRRGKAISRKILPLGTDTASMEPGVPGEPPDHAFDRAFVLGWIAQALQRARAEWLENDPRRWNLYVLRELQPALEQLEPPAYEEIFEELSFSSAKQAMDALTTAKKGIQRHLREIARERILCGVCLDQAVDGRGSQPIDPGEIEQAIAEELGDLRRILGASRDQTARVRERRGRDREKSGNDSIDSPVAPMSMGGDLPLCRFNAEGDPLVHFLTQALAQNPLKTSVSPWGKGLPAAKLDPELADYDLSRIFQLFFEETMDDSSEWSPQQLATMLNQCLEQSIEFSTVALKRPQAKRLRRDMESQGLLLKSLGDLFQHEHPPVPLLQAAKSFARAHCTAASQTIPNEVGHVLYYASIVAALIRTGQRITELNDQELLAGIHWVLEQPWVNESIQALMREGLAGLPSPSPGN